VARAGDAALNAEARRLAARWRSLGHDSNSDIMQAAARSPAVFDRLFKDLLVERDPDLRRALLAALAGSRDPARLRRLFGLFLDDRLDPRELRPRGLAEPVQREVAAAFVREHVDALVKRFPATAMNTGPAMFAGLLADRCDASQRDEIAAWLNQHLVPTPQSQRAVTEAIERMDQCIAWRAIVQPQVEHWLSGR
jgi:alanyl aminopeptidase